MEHKKKKNGADHSDRNIFIGIGIVCVIGLFVLMCVYSAFTMPDGYSGFRETATSIVATNNHVSTLLAQTQVAATA